MNPLAPYEPSARDPFDLRKCGHLLRRAGFGASLPERQRLVREGLAAALQHVAPPLAEVPAADALLNEAIAFGSIERVRAFRVWLALQNTHPLRERLSYFWHGHFATSNSKVQDPRAMALMMATFDRLGTGRFDELLTAMLRDPALLRWLDNDVNTSKQPNENLAREVFELFALGRGNYSERDIKEAARALTGWHVRDGQFFRAGYLHDDGDKEVLGVRGKLDGDDVAAIAAARPESARFLAERWLRFFVHPQPERDEIDALAGAYEAARARRRRDPARAARQPPVLLGARLPQQDQEPRGLRDRQRAPDRRSRPADGAGGGDGDARRDLARTAVGGGLARRTRVAVARRLAAAQQLRRRSARRAPRQVGAARRRAAARLHAPRPPGQGGVAVLLRRGPVGGRQRAAARGRARGAGRPGGHGVARGHVSAGVPTAVSTS
ncbi:MAG: DUF1800 family protein [Planctomycetes bacterium]|nr:DUF1800 family protein [Planctomycetota bacterium]